MLRASSAHFISLMSLLYSNQVKTLSLCHLQAYQGGESDRASPRLTVLDSLASQNTGEAFLLSLDFQLRFNIQSEFADRWDNKRSVEIAYNITSNYNRFSQIRLVAREFDTYRRSVRTIRELVLCSDDTAADGERCSQFVGRDQLFVMHRVKHAPLYETLMEDAVRVRHNTLGSLQTEQQQHAQSYNVDKNRQTEPAALISAHDLSQREEITGVRFYNVEFYTGRVQEDNRLLVVKLDKCIAGN
jgi:hypothetical protein